MRIIMTGADGYIGSHLIKKLEENNEVIVYEGDIEQFQIKSLMMPGDIVLHLAALTGVRTSIEDPEKYWRVNVRGSKKVFEEAERNYVGVVYFSSSNAKEWWTNPYAATKKACEEIAPSNAVGIRPCTVWPGRPDMLYQKLQNNEVDYINVMHQRDFIHIDDFCEIVTHIVENWMDFQGQVIDVGTGRLTSVIDVAEKFGFDGERRFLETPNERPQNRADNSIIRSFFKKEFKNIMN